jgi:hypothetical protein
MVKSLPIMRQVISSLRFVGMTLVRQFYYGGLALAILPPYCDTLAHSSSALGEEE